MVDLYLFDVRRNEAALRHFLTARQLSVLWKRVAGASLTATEKTYYYKFIKPRLAALQALFGQDSFVRGASLIVPGRAEKAAALLRRFGRKHRGQRMLISGSFLFSKEYHDIDLFVFTKYRKEDYVARNVHVTFLPVESLSSLFVASLSSISVANFATTPPTSFDVSLDDVVRAYELLVNHVLNGDEHEQELRDLLLRAEYVSRGVILDPKQLAALCRRCDTLPFLDDLLVNTLILGFRRKELKERLESLIKDYKGLAREYTGENVSHYLETYTEAMRLAT